MRWQRRWVSNRPIPELQTNSLGRRQQHSKSPVPKGSLAAALLFIAAWFLLAVGVSLSGAFDNVSSATLLLAGNVPGLTYFCIVVWSRRSRQFTSSLSLRALTLAEAPRILGGMFLLWKYERGILPAAFALPTGISDVVAGFGAIFAAIVLVSHDGRRKRGFLAWHWFSLGCLILSSLSGILTANNSLGVFRTGLSSQAIVSWPMSLVPTFLGPMMMLFEIAALRHSVPQLALRYKALQPG